MTVQNAFWASRGEYDISRMLQFQECSEATNHHVVFTDMPDAERDDICRQISFCNPPPLVLVDTLRYTTDAGKPAYGRTNECLNWNWLFEKCRHVAIVYFSRLKQDNPQFIHEKQAIDHFWQVGWSMLREPNYLDSTAKLMNPGYDSYQMRKYKIMHIAIDQVTLTDEQRADLAFIRQAVNPLWVSIVALWLSFMKLYRQLRG